MERSNNQNINNHQNMNNLNNNNINLNNNLNNNINLNNPFPDQNFSRPHQMNLRNTNQRRFQGRQVEDLSEVENKENINPLGALNLNHGQRNFRNFNSNLGAKKKLTEDSFGVGGSNFNFSQNDQHMEENIELVNKETAMKDFSHMGGVGFNNSHFNENFQGGGKFIFLNFFP
jgi:hypothetical protein